MTSRQVLIALQQLSGERSEEYAQVVVQLIAHPVAEVRAAALGQLGTFPLADPAPALRALADRSTAVRAAAATAYAALAQDEAVEALVPLLGDAAYDVRVAALAGLLKYGGIEGGIEGGTHLARLLASAEQDDRVEAARALKEPRAGAYRPLKRLLEDPDPTVRRAALKSAPGVADPRLVPTLIAMLRDPAVRRRAGAALVAVGAPAVRPLCDVLGDPAVPRQVKLLIPRLLRRIPLEETYETLRTLVLVNDSHLRLRIYAALSHLRRSLQREPESVGAIASIVREEVVDTYAQPRRLGGRAPALRDAAPERDVRVPARPRRAPGAPDPRAALRARADRPGARARRRPGAPRQRARGARHAARRRRSGRW